MSKLDNKFIGLKINNTGVVRHVAADAILCTNKGAATTSTIITCKAGALITLTHAADANGVVIDHINNMLMGILNDDRSNKYTTYTDSPLVITVITIS
tara:strand:+ start:938 stop:1231 length:294 start_codon:yes stop_codon:yes gene_type:complete